MPSELVTNFQYIRISNKNRAYGTPSNFVMDLSNDTRLQRIKSCWIQSVSVPNVFYNIDSHNNKFIINYGGSDVQIDVEPGFYSAAAIMSEIESQINTASAPETVVLTLDSITRKITFTFSDPTAQIFSTDTQPVNSTIAPYLGIITTSAAGLTTYTADEIPDLSGENMVFLHSKDINLGNTTISTNGSINSISTNRNVSAFCSVPVRVPFLGIIHYESEGSVIDHVNLVGARDMANIHIKLRSSDGRILHLGENHELIIVLKCFY